MRTFALRRISSPLLVSLAVHAAILIAWSLLALQQAAYWRESKRKELTWMDVTEVPKPEAKAEKDRVDPNRSRIVQTQMKSPSEKAVKEAFLGEHNQVVDRETVSDASKLGGATQTAKVPTRPVPRSAETVAKDVSKAVPALSQLGVLQVERLQQREVAPVPNWAPQLGEGEGAPEEYVQGFQKGQSTALNTREYVFYGYFQRIRQRLDLAWTKQLRNQLERFYRRGRQLASDIDYTTRTLVTLNDAGEVVKVQILEESGTMDLDQAAIDAFNRAGPFPNPPHGVVDARGLIEIRWDFVVRN